MAHYPAFYSIIIIVNPPFKQNILRLLNKAMRCFYAEFWVIKSKTNEHKLK